MNISDNRNPDIAADFAGGLLIESDSVMCLRIPAVDQYSRADDRSYQDQCNQNTKKYPQKSVFLLCRLFHFRHALSFHVSNFSRVLSVVITFLLLYQYCPCNTR